MRKEELGKHNLTQKIKSNNKEISHSNSIPCTLSSLFEDNCRRVLEPYYTENTMMDVSKHGNTEVFTRWRVILCYHPVPAPFYSLSCSVIWEKNRMDYITRLPYHQASGLGSINRGTGMR
jgi:hypothetical protein